MLILRHPELIGWVDFFFHLVAILDFDGFLRRLNGPVDEADKPCSTDSREHLRLPEDKVALGKFLSDVDASEGRSLVRLVGGGG